MDFVGLVFGFLFFHRRIIIGFFLLVGLGYFLIFGVDQIPKIQWASKSIADRRDVNNGGASNLGAGLDDPKTPKIETLDSNQTVDKTAGANSDLVPNSSSEPNLIPPSEFSGLSHLLATGTQKELVDEVLRITTRAHQIGPTAAFVLFQDRQKIVQRMLNMELTDSQRVFAKINLIESVSILDSLNSQLDFNVDGATQELATCVGPFLDDPDPNISSLANLAMIVSPGAKLLHEGTVERLAELSAAIDTHFDKIAVNNKSLRKFSELIVEVSKLSSLKDQTPAFVDDTLRRYDGLTADGAQLEKKLLQQTLYFSRVDLGEIVFQMNRSSGDAKAAIDALYSGLELYPDVGIEIYQTALDVIREYLRQDDRENARTLIDKLEQHVLPHHANEKNRALINQALQELKKFL